MRFPPLRLRAQIALWSSVYIDRPQTRSLMRRYLLLAAVLCQPLLVNAAELHDATGRTVQIPDHATRILPAGPPAAVLLEALAPDLMVGWPHAPSAAAHAWLPEAVVALPTVPMLTGRQDVLISP
jgi:iron complex transport system substrate-binding protein